MSLWSINSGEPREVSATGCGRDEVGHRVYDNTHFVTEREAWEHLRINAEAMVILAGQDVRRARAALRKAEEAAGAAVEQYVKAGDGLRRCEQREAAERDGGVQ